MVIKSWTNGLKTGNKNPFTRNFRTETPESGGIDRKEAVKGMRREEVEF